MIYAIGEKTPVIDPSARVAENATLAGDVVLEPECSVWYGAVLRGDITGVRVGAGTNVQDNAVLHNARLGKNVSVGHAAVVDRCTVGDDCLIGTSATMLQGAVIGRGCLVAAGAVVTGDMEIPPDSLVMGVPARLRGTVTEEQRKMMRGVVEEYFDLSRAELPTTE